MIEWQNFFDKIANTELDLILKFDLFLERPRATLFQFPANLTWLL